MADDDERRPLIQPPPGLLPPPKTRPEGDEIVNTGSATRKIRREDPPAPVFFPAATTMRPAAVSDRTVAADGTVIVWNLQLPDGSWHEVAADGTVVGRNPAPPEGRAEAEALPLPDPERSVSKTHALFTVDDGTLLVEDLASTNGVRITVEDRPPSRIEPRVAVPVPDGAVVSLGSVGVRVRRGRKLG